MPGVVYLVGAGPGDPGLLTVRGAACLAAADVVLADHLVSAELIARWAPATAELLVRPAGRSGPLGEQEEINQLLVTRARAGQTVVRLKGGDPFVFGRGGEEAEALAAAGVPFEVVPGVTAAVAAPAYAGIPLTHRGRSGAVVFATGHEADRKDGGGVDWEALARGAGTLVLYMSVTRLDEVVRRLVAAGRAPTEPAAVVECGTLPHQRVVVATLGELAERAAAAGVRPPALTVIGDVVALREKIAWFERGRILLLTTKPEPPLGAGVVRVAPLRVRLLSDELAPVVRRLGDFRVVAFASAHAVDALFAALGGDARRLAGLQVVAVGEGTAEQLRARGVIADAVAAGGGAELAGLLADGAVLVPSVRDAPQPWIEALRQAGRTIEAVDAYETEPDAAELARAVALHRAQPFAAVAFTSPRGVRAFLDAAGGPAALDGVLVGAIGATTRQALDELGVPVAVVPPRPSIDALLDGLRAVLARGDRME